MMSFSFSCQKQALRLCFLFVLAAAQPALAQSWQWGAVTTINTAGNQRAANSGNQSVTDAAGNVYVVGGFGGRFGQLYGSTPGNRLTDLTTWNLSQPSALAMSFTSTGTLRWTKLAGPYGDELTYRPTNYSEIMDVALTPQNDIIVVGAVRDTAVMGPVTLLSPGRRNAFVAKLSGTTGQPVWAAVLPSPGFGTGNGVTVDGAGNVYLTGSFTQTLTCGATTLTSAGGQDGFIASLTSQGQWRWAVNVGGTGTDGGVRPVLDGAGNVCVLGQFAQQATFGPQTLTSTGADMYLATLTPQGQWVTAQNITNASGPAVAGTMAVASGPHGALYFRGVVHPAGNAAAHSVTIGSTVIAASAGGPQTEFVARRDSAGQWTWVRRLEGAYGSSSGLATDPRGNVYLSATTSDTVRLDGVVRHTVGNSGGREVLVLSLSTAGDYQWSSGTDNSLGFPAPRGLSVGAPGQVYVQGGLQRWISFGPFTLEPSTDDADIGVFMAKVTGPAPFNVAMTFAPATAAVGQTVTLTANLPGGLNGLTGVTLNGTTVTTYSVNAAGQLVFTVPTGATTGTLSFTLNGQLYTSTTPLTVQRVAGLVAASRPAPLGLWPNPAHEQVRVTGTAAGTPLQLLDALGRVVRTTPTEATGGTFTVRGLPAGVYVVRSGSRTQRLVIE